MCPTLWREWMNKHLVFNIIPRYAITTISIVKSELASTGAFCETLFKRAERIQYSSIREWHYFEVQISHILKCYIIPHMISALFVLQAGSFRRWQSATLYQISVQVIPT